MVEKMRYVFLLFLLISMVFIELTAVPPPAELTAGKYAEYDINFTMSNTVSLSFTGTFRFEVEERTPSLMKVLVTISFQTPFNIQIKLRYKVNPNTGEIIDVETVQGVGRRLPRELMGGLSMDGFWISKDANVGSTFNIGKTTATIIGSESVTAENGVTYDCWKAETSTQGGKIYYYFEKSTGLLIKQTMSTSTQYLTANLEVILKDTNIVSAAPGILGLLGYINVGGMMIPVLLLVAVIIVIVVVVVLVVVLKKRKAPTPPPPPPPPPPPT